MDQAHLSSTVYVCIGVGVVLFCFILGITTQTRRGHTRREWQRRSGQRADAVVIDSDLGSVNPNRSRRARMLWTWGGLTLLGTVEFTTTAGATHQARVRLPRKLDVPGQTLRIAYDPGHPSDPVTLVD